MRLWMGVLLVLWMPGMHIEAQSSCTLGAHDAPEPEIYVVTMGPGPELFSVFGHAAIYVRGGGDNTVYNFGMYEPSNPDLMTSFLQGVPRFSVDPVSYQVTLWEYKREKRDIFLQRLNLPLEQRRELADKLRALANTTYIYHWYSANCTTRIRDLIDDVMDGALFPQHTLSIGLSPRHEVSRLVSARPGAWLGINFLLGREMDRPMTRWQAMFLPEHFRDALAASVVVGEDGGARPLIRETCQVNVGELPSPPDEPPRRDLWLALLGMALAAFTLGLGLLGHHGVVTRVALGVWLGLVGLVLAALGTFLAYMWLISEMGSSNGNQNLFLMSPLSMAMTVAGVLLAIGRPATLRWAHRCALFLAGFAGLALFLFVVQGLLGTGQDHIGMILLVMPLLIAAERSIDYAKHVRALANVPGARR